MHKYLSIYSILHENYFSTRNPSLSIQPHHTLFVCLTLKLPGLIPTVVDYPYLLMNCNKNKLKGYKANKQTPMIVKTDLNRKRVSR